MGKDSPAMEQRNEVGVTYKASGMVESYLFPRELQVQAGSFKDLVEEMTEKVKNVHFTSASINSSSGYDMIDSRKEPWCQNLIWPEIRWQITKEIKECNEQ